MRSFCHCADILEYVHRLSYDILGDMLCGTTVMYATRLIKTSLYTRDGVYVKTEIHNYLKFYARHLNLAETSMEYGTLVFSVFRSSPSCFFQQAEW